VPAGCGTEAEGEAAWAIAGMFGQLDDGLAVLRSPRVADIVGLMAPAGSATRWTNQSELVTWLLTHWRVAGFGVAKAALNAALRGEPLLNAVGRDTLRTLFTMAAPRYTGWISAWTDGQTAAERLDACLGHVLSIVRSVDITVRGRCLELGNLGYNGIGAIAEVIDLGEVRRFYPGEPADSRALAYALTSAGRRELMTKGVSEYLGSALFSSPPSVFSRPPQQLGEFRDPGETHSLDVTNGSLYRNRGQRRSYVSLPPCSIAERMT
jgi:hypothetical protein